MDIYKELEKNKVGLVILSIQGPLFTDSYEGGLILGALMSASNNDKKNSSERTAQGIRARKKSNKKYCANPPLGYKTDAKGYLVKDKKQQKIVDRIFQLMAEEHNLNRAAKILNKEGYKGAAGGTFTAKTVSKIFDNEIHKENKEKYYRPVKVGGKNG